MSDDLCKHCGGKIAARNPTGACDHLYWPDNLTDEAKLANGFRAERALQKLREIEEELREQASGEQDGYLLGVANRMREALSAFQ